MKSTSTKNPRALLRKPKTHESGNSRSASWTRRVLLALVSVILVPLWIRDATAEGPGGSLREAIAAQEAYLQVTPQDAAAIKDLGNLYLLAGERERAEEAYRAAIGLDPEDAGSHYNLALMLKDSDPKEALRLLRSTVELKPGFAWAHYTLGSVYQSLGRRTAAIKSYAIAFSSNPELALPDVNPDVIGNLDATAALITASPDQGLSAATPRDYADPRRIAGLLVGRDQTLSNIPDGAEAESVSAAGSVTRGSLPRAEQNDDELDDAESAGTDISASEAETSDEPIEGGGERREGATTPAAAGGVRTLRADDLSNSRPNQAAPQPSVGGNRRGGSRGARPTNSRFRPGRRSSARLDLEVVPGRFVPSDPFMEVGSQGR